MGSDFLRGQEREPYKLCFWSGVLVLGSLESAIDRYVESFRKLLTTTRRHRYSAWEIVNVTIFLLVIGRVRKTST